MAGPEQLAANQQQTKRSAETEAHPAPVAKRAVTEEKDVEDAGAVQPSIETNHAEVQPTGDLEPVEQMSVSNNQEGGVPESAHLQAEQLPTETAKAQENLEQDTDEATAKQREVVEAAEEAVKEAVAATVPVKETTHDDQVKVPQESMQNGATQTAVTDEDANGTGKEPFVLEMATPATHAEE